MIPTHPKPQQGDQPKPARSGLAPWFWAAFALMAVATIWLSLAASLRTSSPVPEVSSTSLAQSLDKANAAAVQAAAEKIDLLVDQAYAPVYAAIPAYADFHYSLTGEVVELTVALQGDPGAKLQELLFSDLHQRMADSAIAIDTQFNAEFQRILSESLLADQPGASTLGPLTQQVLNDTKDRIALTIQLVDTADDLSRLRTRTAAGTIGKKLAQRLAVKTSAKSAGKWAVVGTGAGAAGLTCAWSGPVASVCAVAGGVGAFVLSEYGMIKLDELWTRADFEADLTTFIDEDKVERKQALAQALASRSEAAAAVSAEHVQQFDFTLRQLSALGTGQTCEAARALVAEYELMRHELGARHAELIDEYQSGLAAHTDNLSLRRMVQEISENMQPALMVTIKNISVQGDFLHDDRFQGRASAELTLGDRQIAFSSVKVLDAGSFALDSTATVGASLDQPLAYELTLEHKRPWGRNRLFDSAGEIQLGDHLDAATGLTHSLSLPISADYRDKDPDAKSETTAAITVEFQIEALPLPALNSTLECGLEQAQSTAAGSLRTPHS